MEPGSGQVEPSYRRLFKEFLRQSYISGLKVLLLHSPVRYAKALWLAVLAVIVVGTHVIIVNLTLEYIVQPTEIHMAPNLVHVSNSPFPAVAVCGSNRISKRLLRKYAEQIYQQQSPGLNDMLSPSASREVDNLAQRLLVLANFYMNPHDTPQLVETELAHLHGLLSSYYNSNNYSARDILRNLTLGCDHMVVRGIIFGQPVNMSKMFQQRSTSTSICCIFNYRRPSYSSDPVRRADDDAKMKAIPEVIFESNSVLNSMQFVLQDSGEDDYTYTYLSNNAFQLYIFPKEDYATIQAHTSGEVLINHNTIVDIPIQPKFFGTAESARSVTPETRRCYYQDEGRKLLNQSFYTLDECLLVCRTDSMLRHCGCVGPTMAAASSEKLQYCTLLDLPCLEKWKRIWHDFKSFSYVEIEEPQETQSVQQCAHCLPTCNGVEYDISTNVAPLRRVYNATGYFHGLLKGLTNERPLALIRIYFKLRFAQATQMDMVGDWVVLLNRFGGILALMYGFSIISYIEILYYLTGKWFVHFYRAYKKPKVTFDNARRPLYELYWNELLPKGLRTDYKLQQQQQQ